MLVEIINHKEAGKDKVCEIEFVYDNGYRAWEEKTLVEDRYPKIVEEYFEENDK